MVEEKEDGAWGGCKVFEVTSFDTSGTVAAGVWEREGVMVDLNGRVSYRFQCVAVRTISLSSRGNRKKGNVETVAIVSMRCKSAGGSRTKAFSSRGSRVDVVLLAFPRLLPRHPHVFTERQPPSVNACT
jgi:hypothetical protein